MVVRWKGVDRNVSGIGIGLELGLGLGLRCCRCVQVHLNAVSEKCVRIVKVRHIGTQAQWHSDFEYSIYSLVIDRLHVGGLLPPIAHLKNEMKRNKKNKK